MGQIQTRNTCLKDVAWQEVRMCQMLRVEWGCAWMGAPKGVGVDQQKPRREIGT